MFLAEGTAGQGPQGKLSVFQELEECQCAWSMRREGKDMRKEGSWAGQVSTRDLIDKGDSI